MASLKLTATSSRDRSCSRCGRRVGAESRPGPSNAVPDQSKCCVVQEWEAVTQRLRFTSFETLITASDSRLRRWITASDSHLRRCRALRAARYCCEFVFQFRRLGDVGHASRFERATMGSVASVYSSRRVPFSGSSISCPPCMRRMHRAPNCAGRLFYRPTVGSLGTLQCCPVAFTRYSVCLRGATHRIGVDGCAYRFKVHCAHQDGVCTQREARNTACDTYSNWLKTCSRRSGRRIGRSPVNGEADWIETQAACDKRSTRQRSTRQSCAVCEPHSDSDC